MTNLRRVSCLTCRTGLSPVLSDVLARAHVFAFYKLHAGHVVTVVLRAPRIATLRARGYAVGRVWDE
jgi:hypothetical protein